MCLDQEVLIQSQITRLPKPGGKGVDFVNHWMSSPSKGFVYLHGDDRNVWKEAKLHELIAVNAPNYEDAATSWLTRYVLVAYHRLIGRHYKVRYRYLYDFEHGLMRNRTSTLILTPWLLPTTTRMSHASWHR